MLSDLDGLQAENIVFTELGVPGGRLLGHTPEKNKRSRQSVLLAQEAGGETYAALAKGLQRVTAKKTGARSS